MFGTLTEKFQQLFSSLSKGRLTEENIAEAVRKVRLALLEADVNYTVATQFIKRVKDKVLGEAVIRSVRPGEQFTKILHEELVALMGSQESSLALKGSPSVLMLCGLQGAGKTTQCAKLARYLLQQDKKRKILLAACDLQRPAAVEQLQRLGAQVGVEVFVLPGESDPRKVARAALTKAETERYDILIADTAGRLHIDEELMDQLKEVKAILCPAETLFVASAQTGQDAVKTAGEFDAKIGLTGSILTMLDGTARAGAAISIYEVTQKPLKFEGVGEKMADLQPFNPSSMADRILGMGDVVNLVRRAEEQFSKEEREEMEEKLMKATFTYEDYLKQLRGIRKMGPLKGILQMIPGFSSLPSNAMLPDEKELGRMEAIICSMTLRERKEKTELDPSRRRRIARGSGVHVDEVNRMIKNFKKVKQIFKDMPALKKQFLKGAGTKENVLWR